MSDQVIAERQFHLADGAPLLVRWMTPRPDGSDWKCLVEWHYSNGKVVKKWGYSVDSVQALLIAFKNAAAVLYTHEPSAYWFEPDDDLGLPVEEAIRDLRAKRQKGAFPK